MEMSYSLWTMIQPKKCEKCGSDFLPKYRVTAKYWSKRRFCSDECKEIGRRGERRSSYGVERKSLADRFWSKVEKRGDDECWEWQGAITTFGYGYLGIARRQPAVRTHRVSYELNIGPIPDGMCVLHKCDNPPCVNPAHLFLGTRADNNADKMAKGRDYDKQGEHNPRAKLTLQDVEAIKKLRRCGMTQQAIADLFGVCQVNISSICLGKNWKSATSE